MSNREFFATMLEGEKDRFVGVLEAVPEARLDYRPHEKSRSAEELMAHLIGHNQDLVELAETGEIHHRIHAPFYGHADGVQRFSESLDQAVEAVRTSAESDWTAPGKFWVGDKLVYEIPRMQLAWILMLDAIHHRGQLSTYLRPMGGKCPGIYGPSADTMPG